MRLTSGKIIHQAIAIYRANFNSFLKLSLHSSGWLLVSNLAGILAFSGLIGSIGLFFFSFNLSTFKIPAGYIYSGLAMAVTILLMVSGTVLFIFAAAKGRLNEAMIGQMAHEYILGNSAKSVQIFSQLRPQLWQFWIAQIFIETRISFFGTLVSKFDGVFFLIIAVGLQFWLGANWFMSSMLISNEGCSGRSSLKMSTKRISPHRVQVFLTFIFASFLASPLYLLVFGLPIAVWFREYQDISNAGWSFDPIIHLVQALGLFIFLAAGINIVIIPFWQSLKAVLYNSLNMRSNAQIRSIPLD